ncbi:MAG: discoidin domain-containing protein [Verrucomicrobia bacterium]|nr:discoidin domain-containing protein [Verrucomicrobiota bacterium]
MPSPPENPTAWALPAGWQVIASGQARGDLTGCHAPDGRPCLRLDFDFGDGAGFVVIRRECGLTLPEAFTIAFALRGEGPANHCEFKVADPTGANVWRHLRENHQLSADWTTWHVTERGLPFAWGPAGGGAPDRIGAIEIAVVAGPGGKGWLELADFSLTDESPGPPAEVLTSSAAFVSPDDLWSAAGEDSHPIWQADYGAIKRFGGVVIDWPDDLPPRAFRLDGSNDGKAWNPLYQATRAGGSRTHIATPNAEARFLRLSFGHAAHARVRGLSLKPDAFGRTPNEFIHAVAADLPRGWHPRYWHREQSYWTPVGSPAGKRRALINEEGLLETDEAGFSIEPFILIEDRFVTWTDVETRPTLTADGAPLPGVEWLAPGVRLRVEPWVDGDPDALTLRVAYSLECDATIKGAARLALAVRPFQVNPPWQAFRNLGGISPIHDLSVLGDRFTVNGRAVIANRPPLAAGVAAFEEGGVLPHLSKAKVPDIREVHDPSGLASASGIWSVIPGEPLVLSIPFGDHDPGNPQSGANGSLTDWQRTLGKVEWDVPQSAADAVACFRTAAGHILINRDGPAIQPGPRRYTRSWVRDCVIMGAALAKAGLPHALREFLLWYAPFQREDGFVPCVVDRDGIDWLVEHDSHGQLIWGVREWLRSGGGDAEIATLYPSVGKAADYILSLRATRMTPAFEDSERRACYGLLPESASHEGYLAHPVHSYWDDFWGIRGLHAAADLAEHLGHPDDASRWRAEAAGFLTDVRASLDRVIAQRNLTYIPGSVEWADFDPTATANAIGLLDFADALPVAPLRAMLETYLDGFRRKHSGKMPWNNYTAYEIRIIGAFVRLGMRDEAHELLDRFLIDRRPVAWNQWPEITWRDSRSPGHLGDVPHTWIAAEFLLAFASMVVSEREDDASLVLASGLPWRWISGERPFAVRGLPTRFGKVDFSIHAPAANRMEISLTGITTLPAGGIRIVPPLPGGRLLGNGTPHVSADRRFLSVPCLPYEATLLLEQAAPSPIA